MTLIKKLWIEIVIVGSLLLPLHAFAVDISNPMNLLFAADKTANFIDVVDLSKQEVVFRIETEFPVDNLIATPYAPLLFYSNIAQRKLAAYNLHEKRLISVASLPIVPRHIVLDTTGSRIGISDSIAGGFILYSAYALETVFVMENFPPVSDVLFDPNDTDIYYSNNQTGSLGMIDINLQKTFEMPLNDDSGATYSSPSRSLDGRFVYVANLSNGQVRALNAYSRKIYKTFNVGNKPVRPYTTPEGSFLYLLDSASGSFRSIEQGQFTEYNNIDLEPGIDLVAVGRFDRMNLLVSSENKTFFIYDNLTRELVTSGTLAGTPLDMQTSVDGKTAYIGFGDSASIAAVDLESQQVEYIDVTENGASTFSIGLSNQVCH